MAELGVRIGVDVGGTFTDFVLIDPGSGRLHLYKEPSTPDDPARAVASGFSVIVDQAGVAPGAVQLLAHGTTIGLNAIIQRKGARTALVVSPGHRDILELGRCKMRDPLNFFDTKEKPLVPRSHVLETDFRLDARGRVSIRPTRATILALVRSLRALDVESVAIAITNAYLAPDVEAAFADDLRTRLDGVSITTASGIWPEIREYERAMVGLMNAYIAPLMQRYFASVESTLAARGFRGKLHITTSNGGTVSVATARERPIDTILSGPAAGVVATVRFADVFAERSAITVDMGGTSSDMAVVTDAEVEYSLRAHAGDFPLFMPVVSVSAIGAGGGSILRVDDFGVLKVGPESAGAYPGPACYDRGGDLATVTDCYVVCGWISAETKLAGQVALSSERARGALEAIAARLGYRGPEAAERAAWSALKVATAKMATELQKALAMRGIDPTGYALIPFGGAGPTQAAMLASEARLDAIVVPRSPGTFCALGAVLADLKRDFSRTIRRTVSGDGSAALALVGTARELCAEAHAWLGREAELVVGTGFQVVADMRYAGQSYEIPVDLTTVVDQSPDDDGVARAFHREHARVYGFTDERAAVEITSMRVTASGRLSHVDLAGVRSGFGSARPLVRRRIYVDGGWLEATVRDREALVPGDIVRSPAVIEQSDTTTIVPDGWFARIDEHGNLVMRRERAR